LNLLHVSGREVFTFCNVLHDAKQKNMNKQTRTAMAMKTLSKDLMSKPIAVHMRFNSLYISLLSSAKQQHEMTKFWVF